MAIALGQRIRMALRALVDPQGAYGMFAGVFPSGGQPPRRGTAELLQAYANMPWLQAAVRKVSWAVATATFELYVARGRDGKAVKAAPIQRAGYRDRRKMIAAGLKQGTIQQLESHPLLDLLNDANPLMVGSAPRQLTQAWLDLAGEAYWLKERNGAGMPIALWPLPPTWVVEKATPVSPYYRVRFRGWQGEIPTTEIVAFEDPDPADPYGRGVGVARALADELDTDEYAAKHTKTWFYNRARPDLLIAAPDLRREDTERLEQDWLNRHQGLWRAYKPYFINRKVDVIPLSQTFENMQLVDLRKFERDTIVQVFGVPPEVLGIIENSNRATIEAADYLFARWVLVPRLEFFRQVIQERLVPDFDERLIVDYVSPVADDKEYQLNAAKGAAWALTVDEWRELAGLEPLPEGRGQVFMVPLSLVPQRDFGGGPAPEPPAGDSGGKTPRASAKTITPEILLVLLEAVAEEVLRGRMDPVYLEVVQAFGQELLDSIGSGIDFDIADEGVMHFLKVECAQKVRGINETTREALRKTLTEGMELGEGIPKLAKRVSEVFADAKGRRAMVIARTEALSASNFGAWEGMKQGGVPEKEWLATRDDRVRDSHLAADGQIQPVDKPFVLGSGVETMYPGGSGVPEEDIQCFPGDILVHSLSDVIAATKRWYEGELIEIETACGNKLAGTPNHPVLSDRGWIALGALEEGDYIVCCLRREEMFLANPDIDHIPTQIREVFDFLQLVGTAERRSGIDKQFHGDGRTGYVNVVTPNRALQLDVQSSFRKPMGKQLLSFTELGKATLPAKGQAMKDILRLGLAPNGVVSSGGKREALLTGEFGHAYKISLAPGADLYTVAYQSTADSRAAYTVGASQGQFAFARHIPCNNLGIGQAVFTARADPALSQVTGQSISPDAKLSGYLGNGKPLVMQLDRIVHKRRIQWSGHVYNLQTRSQWYIANNIIAHNCRCTTAPVIGGKTMLDTEEKRLAAWRKYDADLRPWERRMETAVKKAFQEQQDAVMELLKELGRED